MASPDPNPSSRSPPIQKIPHIPFHDETLGGGQSSMRAESRDRRHRCIGRRDGPTVEEYVAAKKGLTMAFRRPSLTHSAFAMGYEAGINKSPIDGNLVPPGALLRFVQKGLQYVELEANLNSESDTDDFSFLQPMDLITKDVNELCQIILREKWECIKKKLSKHKEKGKEYDPELETERARVRERGRQEREKEAERDQMRIERGRGQEKEKNKEKHLDEHSDRDLVKDQPQKLQEGGVLGMQQHAFGQ